MPPKRLRSSPEVPLILPANRFRTGASYFPISSAKIQQIFDICKFRGAKNVEEYKKASYFAGSDD